MIDSLRNTYLPYTTLVPPSCTPEPPFFHKYVEDVHVHVHARTRIPISSTYMYERVHACTRTPGTMYGFVARTSNCCAREHQAEGVNVYDKCEIPFRDDYVLLSFGWVTTNPLLPSAHRPPLYLSPFSSWLYRVVRAKKRAPELLDFATWSYHRRHCCDPREYHRSIQSIFFPVREEVSCPILPSSQRTFLLIVESISQISDRHPTDSKQGHEPRSSNKETLRSTHLCKTPPTFPFLRIGFFNFPMND